jgi:prolyl 4-hydroxylase
MHAIHSSPRIATVEKFVSPEICDWLIAHAKPKLERAVVFDAEKGTRIDPGRSNSAHHFPMMEKDLVFLLVQSRIAAVTERTMNDMEVPAILHYALGEEFLPHVDFVSTEMPAYAQQVAAMGQRVVTFLLYLNDDYEGGETEFPRTNIRFKGAKGDALLFVNVDASGAPDYSTLHAGLSPTSGEKWLLSQWIRSHPVNAFMTTSKMPPPLGPDWFQAIRG